jgi:hypothetical protein
VKQDIVEIENQVNVIAANAVLSDGNGNVDGTNGSTNIKRLLVSGGLITREVNKQSILPSARILSDVAAMDEVVVLVEEAVVEPEFLEGKVEASGTGVPADGYAFYRYDDSNVTDGLNSRVEIEMPKNTNKGYIFGRGLTIGTDSKSDSQYKVVLQNAACVTDPGNEGLPTAIVSKRYAESNYVQIKNVDDEEGTRSISLPVITSWSQPSPFSPTNLSGWIKYPPTAPEPVEVTNDGTVVAPSRLGVQFSYTVPPESTNAVGMDNTSPINSVKFTGTVRLAKNFSVAKLWLMDVTDPSDPSVFFESALANGNGSVLVRNGYKTTESTEIDMDPELTDPLSILFSRASPATFINSNGFMEFVGANVPRYDHDPTTLAPKGLLLEPSKTNTQQRTTDMRAWTQSGTQTITTNDFPLLVNGRYHHLITANGTSGIKAIRRGFSGSSNMLTASIYLRRGTNNFAQLYIGEVSIFANFDLVTGQPGNKTATVTSTMTPCVNGWYRCTMSFTSSSAANMFVSIVTSATSVRAEINTLNTSIYVTAPQVEVGTVATSYIENVGTATTTRAADVYTPRPAWDVTPITGDALNDDLQIEFSVWRQGGKLDIGSGYTVPLTWPFALTQDKKMRCVFVVETAGGTSRFTMVKNKVALLSNSVDTAIEPPNDSETRLGTLKRKWKSVHASEFDAHQGSVKNVKLVVDNTTFIGDAVPHTYIQQLQLGGGGGGDGQTTPDLSNYIQKNVDVDISASYTFDSGKLRLRNGAGTNEVAAKSDLNWTTITGKPVLFSGNYDDLSNKPTLTTGPQGPIGETGPAGPHGLQGDKGDTGAQGLQGPTGPVGPQGLQGDAGAQGVQGIAGPQGLIGPIGPQGLKGDKGDTGAQGVQGLTGPIGPQGPKGDAGAQGLQGLTGPAGPVGATGATGAASTIAGPQGLKGDKGDTGAQGIQGLPGPAGPQGPKGDTGAQGLQGTVGPAGPVGATGATGAASTIAGPQGPKGDKGDTGAQGIQGIAGPQGLKGDKGDTGAQGLQGLTGPQGPTGATGATGAASTIAGPQGPIGPTGPAGPNATIANVTGLQTALDGKAASSHTHTIANVTGLQTTLDGKAATSHTHTIANVTNLQTALDGKAASSHTHTIANITDFKTGTWTNINRPEWTNNFGWENVGPFMFPTEASNFDIIAYNSITPTMDYMYNLGQKQKRYKHVYTQFVMCGSVYFNNQTSEMFTGSYNELRDLPVEDTVLRNFENFTSKLGVGGLEREVTGLNPSPNPLSYTTVKLRLTEYSLPPVAGLTINNATLHFKTYYGPNSINFPIGNSKMEGVIPMGLSTFTVNGDAHTLIKQEEQAVVNDSCNLNGTDITRVLLYVNVSTALTLNRDVLCFSDTLSNFTGPSIKDHITNITNRR